MPSSWAEAASSSEATSPLAVPSSWAEVASSLAAETCLPEPAEELHLQLA